MAPRTAVVTGSTQGLGFAYARELLRRGHNVVVCGRREAAVESAAQKLAPDARDGATVVGQVCDTTDKESVQSLWNRAVAEFGGVDIWINNAGYARTGVSLAETAPGEIEAMIRTNVIGTMNATGVAYACMKAQKRGKLYITLGGGSSGRVVRGMTVYSTTKRAIKYFADCLVKDAKDSGVLVGTISPGINVTEGMLREIAEVPADRRAKMLKPINFIGDHPDTTAPWIIDRVVNDTKQGNAIVWLTTGRLLGRALGGLAGKKRDVLSRYGLKV